MNTSAVLTDSLAGVFFPEVYPGKVFAVYRNSEYVVFEMDKKGRSNIVIEGSVGRVPLFGKNYDNRFCSSLINLKPALKS